MEKFVKNFNEFLIENLNEAMDLSDDLKKVKTPEELVSACLNKYLIIHSKHEIRNTNKRGGSWPRMYIIRGFGKTIKLDEVGYSIYGGDIDIFAYDSTEWSFKWTPEDIFNFFMFNRKRGNKIYTVSEIPIAKEMQKIADKIRENKHEINSLLGSDVSDTVGKRGVMAASYVVTGETQSHGERYMEFTADRKDYTYYWNVYSYEPSLISRRRTSKLGWERNQHAYRVSSSTASKILKLVNEIIELYNDAKKTMSNYYKSENLTPNPPFCKADVSSRLSSADQEELQKCKDSPVYFYNKYVRKEGQKELTEAEYNDFVKQVEYQRNMPLKLRRHYKDHPMLPSECFEKLPDFLKNDC